MESAQPSSRAIQLTSHFGSEFSGVRELAPDRLHNQTTSNRTSARQNTNRLAIDKCFHTLKVWSEFSLGDTGGLDTDSTKIFRLTSPSNSVSRSGTGSSKKANAWHSYLRRVEEDRHIRWELQVFEMTGQFPPRSSNRSSGQTVNPAAVSTLPRFSPYSAVKCPRR